MKHLGSGKKDYAEGQPVGSGDYRVLLIPLGIIFFGSLGCLFLFGLRFLGS